MYWYKLFFDERPKQQKKDLYDFEAELEKFCAAVRRGDPLIVLVGLRRTGKTSLLLTGLRQVCKPSVVLDMRALAAQAYGTRRDLLLEFQRALNSFLNKHGTLAQRLVERLKEVKGVGVSAKGVSLTWGGKDRVELVALFEKINEWASGQGEQALIAFDEAQELKKVAGVDVSKLLAYCYDNYRNVSLILTGSAVGLLYDLLGNGDPDAPLYGRSRTEIAIPRLTTDKATEFLTIGFKQAKLRTDPRIIDQAIERLDGVIGWLTTFGAACIKQGFSEDALEHATENGKAIAKREFGNFLRGREAGRRRYVTIVRHLATGASSWSNVKRALEAREGRILNDRNVTQLLTTLVKAGFVEKGDDEYKLSDPMLAQAFL